ncbi:BspA family leucine-rich repeat surface protein [Butyrivibrio sp. MB2005]|uniref:BspA family leucine-rich repeat surface protein n=1 Tax=Butyrivibrio sp. MB2005 TaxID=1280678 RepID=UPI0003FC5610|nr:BspA family leucine-rich repeat surface protein [Butyrivibrio sp. MB2005]
MDFTKKLMKPLVLGFCFLFMLCLSKQITKAQEQDTTWQNEFSIRDTTNVSDYDSVHHYLFIRRYTGNASVVTVPSKAVKDGVEYTTVVTGSVFSGNQKITSVTFEQGCKAADMGFLFDGCRNLTSITFNNLDTSLIGSDPLNPSTRAFVATFEGCEKLTSLDLSFINSTNATDMCRMFAECSSLESVNLRGLDTSKVTNMLGMFDGCDSLKTLDLSGFDTSNCEQMRTMFKDCSSLEKITFGPNFKAQKVSAFNSMFYGCTALASIDLSTFDTSNATTFASMFGYCQSLASFNFGNLNTSKVNDMSSMFYECTSLASVDFGSIDTSNVTNISHMFRKNISLKTLDLSGFNAASVSNADYIFYEIPTLATVDSPKNLSVNIMFSGDYKYYLDDNKDGIPDSTTSYTGMLQSAASHRYIGKTDAELADILPKPQTISFERKKIKIAKGDQFNITYKSNAKKISWSTSDKKVATITQSGTLKGKKKGKCTITATTDGGASATCEVTVQSDPIKLKSVKASKKKLTLKKGKKYSCYTDFAMLPYNFSIKNISFKSSNKSVAKVNKNSGLITPKKKGKCEITVTVKDRAGTIKTCKIKVVVK